MANAEHFDAAVGYIEAGQCDELRQLLAQQGELVTARDESNATLLIRLIDWPGYRPNSAQTARVLIEAGAEIDARRDDHNGTALAGALCTREFDVVTTLVELGADIHAPLGWMPGTNLDLADRICQDLGKQRSQEIIDLSRLFTAAAGRKIPSQAPFGGSTPLLFVGNVQQGIEFYTQRLGCHVDWIHEEPDSDPYVGMSRGSFNFHLTSCSCDDQRHLGNTWLRIECDLIDDLYAQLDTEQINTIKEPKDQPWGFRELMIEDPDGNRLTFFGPTTGEPE